VTVHLLPRSVVKQNPLKLLRRALALGLPRSDRMRDFRVETDHRLWALKRRLKGIVAQHGVELLHCFSSLPDSLAATLVGTELGVPVAVRMGGRYWYSRQAGMRRRAKRRRYLDQLAYVFDHADCLAYNSPVLQAQARELLAELGITTAAKEIVIDIGVRLPQAANVAIEGSGEFGRNGELVVACVGKCKDHSKRQDLVIRAVARLGEELPLRVYFAGGGPRLDELRRLGEEQGVADRLVFLGDVPHDAVFRLLARADVVVHATEFEGSSKAVSEAMLCGKAVIASDIPALREQIIDGQTGLLVANDAARFAEQIVRLWRDAPERERLGVAAREFAREHFDPERNASRYEALFRSVIDAASR
jgi:glycosyltransferase involved in cell wall biosynthesis